MITLRDILPESVGHRWTFVTLDTDTDTDGGHIPYGRWTEVSDDSKANAVLHDYLSGSDYSGGALVRANIQSARARIGDDCPALVTATGDYRTEALLVALDVHVPEDVARTIAEILTDLDTYPCIDKDVLADVEHNDETAAWEAYAAADFRREIERAIGVDADFFTTDHGKLHALWQAVDGYVEHEETGPWFDVSAAAAKVQPALAFALLYPADDYRTGIELALAEPDYARAVLRMTRIGDSIRTLLNHSDLKAVGAAWHLLRATYDVGDSSAELSAETLSNVPARSYTISVSYVKDYMTKPVETRSVSVTVDPCNSRSTDNAIETLLSFFRS